MTIPEIKDMQKIGAVYLYAEKDYFVMRMAVEIGGKELGMEELLINVSLAKHSAPVVFGAVARSEPVRKAVSEL